MTHTVGISHGRTAPKGDAKNYKDAMFGAGCFWGVQNSFDQLPGIIETEVGYSGGKKDNPNYKEVCKGMTGHAEVVHIRYDPSIITYQELLDHFWRIHDPTTPNRQGPDVGSQYRSAIFYYDTEQRDLALDSERKLASSMPCPIVTEITPAKQFWKAEEYHQKYFKKNPGRGCRV